MSAEIFQKDILPVKDKMYRYALSIVFDVELAKDIVQEVLMKIWVKRSQLPTINNKEAWCIRLTRNLSLDKLKSVSRKNVGLEGLEKKILTKHNPELALEGEDLLASIYQIMKDLPEKQREVFRLRDLMGYSNAEIKAIMELTDSQVKVNLFRARQKVRLYLGKLINYGL